MELAERAVQPGSFCPFAWATRGYLYFLSGQWDAPRADLEIAWKRATFSQRREGFAFWWMLASLQNNPLLAFYREIQARRESRTDWQIGQVRQISKHVRHSWKEHLRHTATLAWMRKGAFKRFSARPLR